MHSSRTDDVLMHREMRTVVVVVVEGNLNVCAVFALYASGSMQKRKVFGHCDCGDDDVDA